MSGIFGWIDYEGISDKDKNGFLGMENALIKRGENSSYIQTENALLGQRQNYYIEEPFHKKFGDKEYIIIFSGKLFNAKEIYRELIEKDYVFENKSDEEIVLYAYIEWGVNSVFKLNGNFAYAVWDKTCDKLFMARDRMGIMPLFFFRYPNGIIFASEIKALLKSGIVKAQIDNYGIKQLLLLGPSRSVGCAIFKGMEELAPAEFLIADKESYRINVYWKPTAKPHRDNLAKTVETTRELIIDSINRQLEGDVTPACFLSGGLDSSIITAVAAENYKKKGLPLHTYSVDYENNDKFFVENSFQSSRDNYYIDIMQNFTGSTHKYFVLDNLEVGKKIFEAGFARDLPGMADIDSSLLLLCEKVKAEQSICMSGECADEFFGGYPWYHRPELLYRDNFPWINGLDVRLNLFNQNILGRENEEFVYEQYKKTVNYTDYLPSDDRVGKRVREMFMLNYYWFMQTLIDRTDRMSTYSGLEVRVPYCDNKIIDYAFNMPWDYKALRNREKGIMREAFKDLLPKEIVYRKKTPYPKTFNPDFEAYVINTAENLMEDKKSLLSQIVNKDYFDLLKSKKVELENPWYGQLMRLPQIFGYLIQLDIFFKTFDVELI